MYFADLDGDRSADLLQVAGNRLFAFRSDHQGTPILHEYFEHDVTRLFAGDFTRSGREHGKDQVCGLFADGALRCYAISDDGTDLWWWFSQPSFVAANEHAVVGDFDGDGADDVLVYKPSTGAVRVYTRASDGVFRPMPRFSPGNLASADLVGKKLLAGEFGQATGRDDLLVLDPPTGRVSRFDAATEPSGTRTFWWAFDTAAGAVRDTEQLSVARLDGSGRDGLVLRNRATGGAAPAAAGARRGAARRRDRGEHGPAPGRRRAAAGCTSRTWRASPASRPARCATTRCSPTPPAACCGASTAAPTGAG